MRALHVKRDQGANTPALVFDLGSCVFADRRIVADGCMEEIMGLLDELNLGGAMGQIEATAAPALINALMGKTQFGDLNGLLAQLQKGGLGQQVQSWLGNGANMPISADQLKAALGNSQVQEIARHLGLPVDAALNMLSQHLPTVVDQASENGHLNTSS
jgi:uncharacterized protein YidB (DUF937 family)